MSTGQETPATRRSHSEFQGLGMRCGIEDWRRMSLTSSPPLTPEWASAWLEAYGSAYHLDPTFRDRGEGEALLPLVRHRRRPWRLELLGARELGEPMDVVATDDASIDALVDTLASRREHLELRRVPAGSTLVSAVTRAYRGRVLVRSSSGSPKLPVDPSWDEPERHMSKRRRSDLRRAARRAEELGEVSCDVVDGADGDLDRSLDEFVGVEARGWRTRAGTALACVPGQQRFFRAYARELALLERRGRHSRRRDAACHRDGGRRRRACFVV